MILPSPIEIDLLEFFRTGKFDFIKLGQTKEWIINNFPDQDEVYADNYNSPIWFYGNIEFHFYDDETLFLVYSDYIDTLDGGKSINLKKWILGNSANLTLAYVIENLNRERIAFTLKHRKSQAGDSCSIHLTQSNVSLSFNLEEAYDEEFEDYLIRCKTADVNTFKLVSFSLTNDFNF